MQRGEVWWTEFPAPIGRRPVVLLSRNRVYEERTSVTVAGVTSTIRHLPVEVRLGEDDRMPRDCVVNLDEIHTVTKTRLIDRITTLSPDKMEAVRRAAIYALDLD